MTLDKSEKGKFVMQNAGSKVGIKLLVWMIVLLSGICKSKMIEPQASRANILFKIKQALNFFTLFLISI